MATKVKTPNKPAPAAKTAPAASRAVGPANKTALVAVEPSMSIKMAQYTGAGLEEANRDAFAIPFLTILQDLSPQVKSKMAGYIEGAKPGQFFQSVTQECIDPPIKLIHCYYSQVYIEWKPRAKGGGFVALYDPVAGAKKMQTAVRDEENKLVLPNGNEIYDTRQHYCLLVRDDGRTEGVLVPLKSTSLKMSRRWMSNINSAIEELNGKLQAPPSFAYTFDVGMEEESNDQGQWWQWTFSNRTLITDPELFDKALAFYKQVRSGQGKVNYEELNKTDAGGNPDATASKGPGDVPKDLKQDIDA